MAKTGENIYKRKDGRWEGRYIHAYDSEGKAKYRSVYGISRQETKQKLLLLIHEFMSGLKTTASPVILFKDLANNWLNNVKLRIKESTYARYNNQVEKRIFPHLGKYQASKISTELIEQLITHMLKPKETGGFGLSPKTTEDILIIIKSILKFGNFHAQLELHRIKIKKEDYKPRVLSKQIQKKLNKGLGVDVIKAGILLSLHTGIRIGELCALKWSDIDLEEQVMHIEKTMQRIQISDASSGVKTKVVITSPKSKKSIRSIHIPNFLTVVLRKLKSGGNHFLLTGSIKYMEPRSLHNHFKKYLKYCDVEDFNFHVVRHTFATGYVEAGFDVKSLSEILGHSNSNITLERYVHSSNELKRTNIEKLAERSFYIPSEIPSKQYAKAL